MSQRTADNQKPGFVSPGVLLAIRVFALVALGVSAYLAYVTFGGSAVAGCGPDSGCDKVLQSRWSKWFGVPVSLFAVLTYGALFALTFRLNRKITPLVQRGTWKFLLPLAALVIASVLWFAALQLFVLKQVCPYCMTVHGAGLIAAALLLWAAPLRNAPQKPWQAEKQVFVPPHLAARACTLALLAFAIFAAGQLLYRPKTFSETAVGAATQKARMFSVYDGKFQFDLSQVPLIGAPEASNAIVSLFDYTCHHCRIMHWHLLEAHRNLSNQLAIVSLPMPLDNQCNYTVRQTPRPHTNACEFAKLGLAVWRANRNVHHVFDDWIFTPEHPPELPQARQFAAQLVGSNQLAQALQDPWIPQQLMQGVNLYATNFSYIPTGDMPQLLIGGRLTKGTFANVVELYRILNAQLGLKTPESAAPQVKPPSSG
jgi:uncharacterized membrane protein